MTAVAEVAEVAGRLSRVRDRIAEAGGDPAAVTVVAVTKGFGANAVEAALAAGVADVGESYAQELAAKAEALAARAVGLAVRWHFVGRVQTNKVARVAPLVEVWQSVDRMPLIRRLGQCSAPARVLVQVNVSGEPGKGGCAPADAPALVVEARRNGLEVSGLMAVGRAGPPEGARPGFRRLRELADGLELTERSMGMSGDLEVAVEEGSTMVRVGEALFGPRPTPAAAGHAVAGVRK
ncbi:MAG: YggS family pyridoxal phosphate-dependent enzyme [Actinomycetota bacterium]|nr:YggS family pyridoxal phosphate-dependent enzyme [Actinomycetota bacterium]